MSDFENNNNNQSNNDQYNNSQNNNEMNNNSQYYNDQHNNSQYNNDQYSNSQYNNEPNNNSQSNYNQANSNSGSYYQNQQYNKVPDYSVWAEQTQGQANSNYNPGYQSNTWDYNHQMNQNSYYANPNNTDAKKKKREPGKGTKVFKFIVKAACFGLIAGISFFGISRAIYLLNPNASAGINDLLGDSNGSNRTYEIGYTERGSVKSVDNSAVSKVTKETIPSIVSIHSTSTEPTQWFGQRYEQEVEGSGSGIIVGKNDNELLIATNNHVVEGTDKITVTFTDGTEAAAEIKGTDAAADLAVVTVDISKISKETLDVIEIVKLGNSDDVKVGEMVIAIGNALGYGQSVTVGYISAKDREVDVSDGYYSKKMILLQTDAAINPGNSGGALLNINGELIGINTVKYASNEVEGMGYAIPISRALPIITDLMNRETLKEADQGYLGIAGNDVTEEISSFYNMPVGVYINEISPGGAAEKAGLQPGDIITVADDRDITSITQLRDYVNSLRVGTQVEITYMRNLNGQYEEGKVTVTLGKNPNLATTP